MPSWTASPSASTTRRKHTRKCSETFHGVSMSGLSTQRTAPTNGRQSSQPAGKSGKPTTSSSPLHEHARLSIRKESPSSTTDRCKRHGRGRTEASVDAVKVRAMSSLRHGPHRSTCSLPYPSDLTDAQWRLIEPLLPPEGSVTGLPCRPLTHSRRRIVNAIEYVARTGCAWRQLPHDFPSWKTVYWYFTRWSTNGTLDHLHNALREKVRVAEGRNPEPTAGIVDAQSIRGADTVGKDSRGYDAGKKINGRKRNIVVDTIGMLLIPVVTAANVQDRDGGNRVITQLHKIMPSVRCIWADGGYA